MELGNTSNSTYGIDSVQSGNTVGYTYQYDQLNRLKKLRQHNLSSASGTWDNNTVNTDHYSVAFDYDGNGNILALKRNAAGTTMDQLAYRYKRGSDDKLLNNKLSFLRDAIIGSAHTGELTDSTNYDYDAIGNLITDSKEGITGIDWTVYGKINKTNAAGNITYGYDPIGNRVSKTINGLSTWYVRDAQGNSLAVYDNKSGGTNWREQQLYGSSRLGMWKPNFNLAYDSAGIKWNCTGLKFFELSNHLGNVMSVISDDRTLTGGEYTPTVMNAQDYYAFGSVMPGRDYTLTGSSAYRYGFNGKENDNEVKGTGNQQDYGMRIYDPRIGKFLSVDPITKQYPELTPYQFASNTPIAAVDLDGLESAVMTRPTNANVNTSDVLKGYHDAVKKGTIGLVTATDVNDATVLATWMTRGGKAINLDGSPATNWDKGLAAAGIFIPAVSGSALKQAAKWGSRGVEWLKYAAKGEKVADAVAGGSSALSKALVKGGADMAEKEAHHIIPVQLLKEEQVVQDAVNAGFDFNGTVNGIAVKNIPKLVKQ